MKTIVGVVLAMTAALAGCSGDLVIQCNAGDEFAFIDLADDELADYAEVSAVRWNAETRRAESVLPLFEDERAIVACRPGDEVIFTRH